MRQRHPERVRGRRELIDAWEQSGQTIAASRIEELGEILLASKEINPRIETVTLRPGDFDRPYFGLGAEIERAGVEV